MLAIGGVLLHAVPACIGGDELNPQPLPPRSPPEEQTPVGNETSGSNGGSAGPPTADADGGLLDADGGTEHDGDAGGDG